MKKGDDRYLRFRSVALICHRLKFLLPRTVGNSISLLQGFRDRKSGIKFPATRTFFPACFLPSRSRGRHSRHLAFLRSHILRAYCNFELKQAISRTLFGRHPNEKPYKCKSVPRLLSMIEEIRLSEKVLRSCEGLAVRIKENKPKGKI